jgi:hypothetical protein
MKTYEEAIEWAGQRIYNAYMVGNSYTYHLAAPSKEIAFIYEKTVYEVDDDCKRAFERILAEK